MPLNNMFYAAPKYAVGQTVCLGLSTAFCLFSFGASAAETNNDLFSPAPAAGWIITVGAVGEFSPRYEGAKDLTLGGLPTLSWRRVGEPVEFSSPEDGLDFTVFSTDRFQIGPVANLKFGRSLSDDAALIGLRDIPWSIEGGVFIEYWPIIDHLRTRAELRQGFNGRQGFVADLAADWVEKFGHMTLSGGPRLSLADGTYMDTNFGITPAEAIANGGVPAFNPTAGLKSVGIGAALKYDWSDTWATTGFVKYDRLVDDAARSPIVQVLGDKDQFTLGAEVTYSFVMN